MEITGGAGGRVGAVIVVDVANVMGSRPDGWWRDRAGAAARVLRGLTGVPGRPLDPLRVRDGAQRPVVGSALHVVAVLEGRAREVPLPPGAPSALSIERADGLGDDAVVEVTRRWVEQGWAVVVVTADRELRRRVTDLSTDVAVAGPRALDALT